MSSRWTPASIASYVYICAGHGVFRALVYGARVVKLIIKGSSWGYKVDRELI